MSLDILKSGSLFSVFSSDIGFLLIIFIVIFAISYFMGRGFIVSLILSFYPATLLFETFPFTEKLIFLNSEKFISLNKIGIFLLFLIPITIIANRFIFSSSDYGGGKNVLKLGGLSIAVVILVVLFSYKTANYDSLHDYSSQIDTLFLISERQFYWFVAPLALLAFL